MTSDQSSVNSKERRAGTPAPRGKKRVQGFDVGRLGEDVFIFALVDQGFGHRLRKIPGLKLKANSAIEFLREAWADGFGGGQPETLAVDGAVREYHHELRAFLKDVGVRVRLLPSAGRGMRGKLERALEEWRAGTPAPRAEGAQS